MSSLASALRGGALRRRCFEVPSGLSSMKYQRMEHRATSMTTFASPGFAAPVSSWGPKTALCVECAAGPAGGPTAILHPEPATEVGLTE